MCAFQVQTSCILIPWPNCYVNSFRERQEISAGSWRGVEVTCEVKTMKKSHFCIYNSNWQSSLTLNIRRLSLLESQRNVSEEPILAFMKLIRDLIFWMVETIKMHRLIHGIEIFKKWKWNNCNLSSLNFRGKYCFLQREDARHSCWTCLGT